MANNNERANAAVHSGMAFGTHTVRETVQLHSLGVFADFFSVQAISGRPPSGQT
jgi:hypothetical protein